VAQTISYEVRLLILVWRFNLNEAMSSQATCIFFFSAPPWGIGPEMTLCTLIVKFCLCENVCSVFTPKCINCLPWSIYSFAICYRFNHS
jgi:hypothetical protein